MSSILHEDLKPKAVMGHHNGGKNGTLAVIAKEQQYSQIGDLNTIETGSQKGKSVSVQKREKTKYSVLRKYFLNKTKGWTSRQKLIVTVFIFVEFFAASEYSLQALFYPKVAEDKGSKAWQHGCVFGVFELIVFVMSPIFGTLMQNGSPKYFYNYGILTTGISCIVFGFLNHIDNSNWFIMASVFVRAIEAIGEAAFVTASFTIIAVEFPDSVATTFATMETFYGLGMIVGPLVGGLLYDIGGYTFPFALLGCTLLICAVATFYAVPSADKVEKSNDKISDVSEVRPTSGGFAIFRILKIPAVAIIAYSLVSTTAGVGFLADTLQSHLKQFGIESAAVAGCVFILNGGVYALSAPIWGRICDKIEQKKYITLAGAMFTIFGFLTVGPSSFIPYDSSIELTCFGLILFGLGLGATLVSAYLQMLEDSIENGYPDELSTYGYVSGLWNSMAALGFFIGPVAGGVLLDLVGFRQGTHFIIAGQLFLVCFVVLFLVRERMKSGSAYLEEITEVSETDLYTQLGCISLSKSDFCIENLNFTMKDEKQK